MPPELRAAVDAPHGDRGRPARRWQWPRYSALLTWLLAIMAPSSAFFAATASGSANAVSPNVPAVGILLVVASTLLMALTSFTDPGKVPQIVDTRPPDQRSAVAHVTVNGVKMRAKYCSICGVFRPLRASHCRETDRCVEKWDHYCPWVGTAIGRRNYGFFVAFVGTTCALAFYVATSSLFHLSATGSALDPSSAPDFPVWLRVIVEAPVAFLLVGYGLVVGVLLLALLSYHIYLIGINQTTYENVRGAYEQLGTNPFDRGVIRNLGEVVCPPCFPPPAVTTSESAPMIRALAEDLEAAPPTAAARAGGGGGGGGEISPDLRRGGGERATAAGTVELVAVGNSVLPPAPPDTDRPPSPPVEPDDEE